MANPSAPKVKQVVFSLILLFLRVNSLRVSFNLKTRGRYSKDTGLLLKLVKMVSEGKNIHQIVEIIANLVHFIVVLTFVHHFLDYKHHPSPPRFRQLKPAELPNFDLQYLKFQCELTTFPPVQA